MSQTLASRHARPAPRYTSYPTAPHFHDRIDNGIYRQWLDAIAPDDTLSLYLHIPFCDTLCWFCGCHTKHTRRYDPVASYLPVLEHEVDTVSALVDPGARVKTIHWGGGSPTMLTPDDMTALSAVLRERFALAADAEFSVEIDPRDLDDKRLSALARSGVTRASIGVQDFDPAVQKAINRIQSFEQTRDVVDALTSAGIGSINFDLIYGLPHQTERSVARTVEQVLTLRPSRIAVFGYAHVPWMKKHQQMIHEDTLPGAENRLRQSRLMADLLTAAGYEAIGMDHFALPEDPLALARREGRLRRNFQGYTDDPADVLLGFGASAIGKLAQGYVHNATPTAQYTRMIDDEGLAITTGFELSDRDRLRAHVIERLICDFSFSVTEVRDRYGNGAADAFDIAEAVAAEDEDGLVAWDRDVFAITPRGRPFVRNICARFDGYLTQGGARYSQSV